MKTLLISPYSDIASLGLRIISSRLREVGHETMLVFLPHCPEEESGTPDSQLAYPDQVLMELEKLCRQADVIGITVMTNYLERAKRLSKVAAKNENAVIVWGGIHPTIRPGDALGFADYAIVGEGEEAFVELLEYLQADRNPAAVANLAHFLNGEVVCNSPRPLAQDLDQLPFPDYGPQGHYIWDRAADGLIELTPDLLKKHLLMGPISRIRGEVSYQTLSTRGCPHRCAYCCNDVLQELYKGQRHLRRRSDESVIEEISQARKRFPFIQGVGFSDDSFFAASEERIEAFAKRYKSEVDLPFFCLGSPMTITKKKLEVLLDAGLYGLQMGVQTGSPRMLQIYNRRIPIEKTLEAVRLLHRFKDRMIPPSYDFIINSPWETTADNADTLCLIRQFPRPYRLQLFSLVIFPETALYRRGKQENLIGSDDRELYELQYHARKPTYVNLVLGLYRYPLPKPLLDFLSHPIMLKICNHPALNLIYGVIFRFGRWLNRRLLKNR